MDDPGVDMLAHGSEHQAEEPAVAASGASLKQVEVILLPLDGALGAGAGIFVALPKVTIPWDEGMESVVLLGIGVEDPAVG